MLERLEWLSQLRRGTLEYSILLLVSKKSMYGYELLSHLSKWEILSTMEGTLYPLLRRLEKDNMIKSTWKNTVAGVPPRKYYDLTDDGRRFLGVMNDEWCNLTNAILEIKDEGYEYE